MAPSRRSLRVQFRSRKPYKMLRQRQKTAVRKKCKLLTDMVDNLNMQQSMKEIRKRLKQRNYSQQIQAEIQHVSTIECSSLKTLFPEVSEEFFHVHTRDKLDQMINKEILNRISETYTRSQTNNVKRSDIASDTQGKCDWETLSFPDKLIHAFISTEMTHVQMSNILRVLYTHSCHRDLPLESRNFPKKEFETL